MRVVRDAAGVRFEAEGTAEVRISLAAEVPAEPREWTVRVV